MKVWLVLLLRCLSLVCTDSSCDDQTCAASDATVAIKPVVKSAVQKRRVLLQVTAEARYWKKMQARRSVQQRERQSDVGRITLTTTPNTQWQLLKARPTLPEDVKITKPVPHDPHNNFWYWPWTRPANGNFEVGSPGNIPDHWRRFRSFGTTGLLSTEQARSGNHSVWFSGPGWELIETGPLGNERLSVTRGSNYSVSFWARSTISNQNIRTMFAVHMGPSRGCYTRPLRTSYGAAQKFHYVSVANVWQRFQHSFTAAEWTNKVRINIGPSAAKGSVWVDDILLSRERAEL